MLLVWLECIFPSPGISDGSQSFILIHEFSESLGRSSENDRLRPAQFGLEALNRFYQIAGFQVRDLLSHLRVQMSLIPLLECLLQKETEYKR